ncbi:MAG: N-acetylmannosamine-6-phosphate 2-epimerase [Eubacteriales bacterium]|nr:N-acetylmannosamine-6-phosphate 2-epimerase [Eubacteriales bacterium]
MNAILDKIKGQLIVSCQALPTEAMYSADYPIMKHFAQAALRGGAGGVRANTVRDINAIRAEVPLPVIGIIKREFGDNPVYITPTLAEVRELAQTGVEIIALDATSRERPDGVGLDELFARCKTEFPQQLFMADCSTPEEGLHAWEIGFDLIGTTLSGYTAYTKGTKNPNLAMMRALAEHGCRVIAEGGIWTPEDLQNAMQCGVHAAVVGTAITRPMEITQRFADALKGA